MSPTLHHLFHTAREVGSIAGSVGGCCAILFLASRAVLKYLPFAARPGPLNTFLTHLGLVLDRLTVL